MILYLSVKTLLRVSFRQISLKIHRYPRLKHHNIIYTIIYQFQVILPSFSGYICTQWQPEKRKIKKLPVI
jgi:hypothetical protein